MKRDQHVNDPYECPFDNTPLIPFPKLVRNEVHWWRCPLCDTEWTKSKFEGMKKTWLHPEGCPGLSIGHHV